jgi:hypothetical protein
LRAMCGRTELSYQLWGGIRIHGLRLVESMRPYPKNKLKAKRAESVAQVVGHLPRKHKALNSIPSTTQKVVWGGGN